MSHDCYRQPAGHDPDKEPTPGTAKRPWDVTAVLTLLWLVAAGHLLFAWRRGGLATTELTTPWVVFFLAPLAIWKERFS